MDRHRSLITAFCLALGLVACGSDENVVSLDGFDAPRNVTQGGAQDIGEFRRAIASGNVPASSTLDEVGFFAEHAIDLPPATCESSVCSHPMLAVAPRFDGGNWTMAFIGMNTALDPVDLPKRPKHLIVVVENAEAQTGSSRPFHPVVLRVALAGHLAEEDRVTIVDVNHDSTELQIGLSPEEYGTSLLRSPAGAAEEVDLYAALAEARTVALDSAFDGFHQRVLVFTSGRPAAGATQLGPMTALAEEFAAHDIGISTFGLGADYRREIPQALAEAGAGSSYVVVSDGDLVDAVAAEAASAFVPIARDLTIQVEAASGYRVGSIYGARQAVTMDGVAHLSSPVLFMGAREGSDSMTAGRRGGGGGWFVQLVAETEPGEMSEAETAVVTVRVEYDDALTGEHVVQETTLDTPHGAGNNPPPESPYFSDEERAKPFMMLNMLMALRGAVQYYEQSACPEARGMRDMMELSYLLWQEHYADGDIDDDFELLEDLTAVIEESCDANEEALWPVVAEVSCFYF